MLTVFIIIDSGFTCFILDLIVFRNCKYNSHCHTTLQNISNKLRQIDITKPITRIAQRTRDHRANISLHAKMKIYTIKKRYDCLLLCVSHFGTCAIKSLHNVLTAFMKYFLFTIPTIPVSDIYSYMFIRLAAFICYFLTLISHVIFKFSKPASSFCFPEITALII